MATLGSGSKQAGAGGPPEDTGLPPTLRASLLPSLTGIYLFSQKVPVPSLSWILGAVGHRGGGWVAGRPHPTELFARLLAILRPRAGCSIGPLARGHHHAGEARIPGWPAGASAGHGGNTPDTGTHTPVSCHQPATGQKPVCSAVSDVTLVPSDQPCQEWSQALQSRAFLLLGGLGLTFTSTPLSLGQATSLPPR